MSSKNRLSEPGLLIILKLCGVDKFEPVFGGGDIDRAEEAFGELVVACCDGAVDFQAANEGFDVVSFPVGCSVMLDLDPAV